MYKFEKSLIKRCLIKLIKHQKNFKILKNSDY
jgi:hypothetical protein